MELRQLRYLVAVVDEGGFTKAAAKLHVAQPGISAQVRQLERELGESLLDRSGRVVLPTAAGRAVLPHARAALRAVLEVHTAVDELAGLVRGRVGVGTVTSHNVDIPGLVAEFHRRYPGVEITLTESDSTSLIDRLGAGRLDLALIGTTETAPAGLEILRLAEEPLVAAVTPGDRLARAETVSLSTLITRDLICLSPGTAVRAALDAACARKRLQPRVMFESGNPGTCARLAERGLGVGVLQKSIIDNRPELRGIPIVRPQLRGWLALAWRSDGPLSPAARHLVSLARKLLPSPDD
ncbi:MAG: LysR family transcriptional regulator [Stackebrandtia sp.]